MIKQIIPVPDNLTAVIPIPQTDGICFWEDAAKNGHPVFLALTDEDTILPVVIGSTGAVLDAAIQFRPSVRCPSCGQKMWVAPHKDLSEPLVYECPGGDCMRRVQVS